MCKDGRKTLYNMYCVQSLTPFAPDNSVSAGVVASLTFDRKWPIHVSRCFDKKERFYNRCNGLQDSFFDSKLKSISINEKSAAVFIHRLQTLRQPYTNFC